MTKQGIICHLMATALDDMHDAVRKSADGLSANRTPDYLAIRANIVRDFEHCSVYFQALANGEYSIEEIKPTQDKNPAEHLLVCAALRSPIIKGHWGFDGGFMLHMGRTRGEAERMRMQYLARP